ncbi:hypothetical protein OUZ56_009633 [Daphnia magna]|uniref:GMP synthase n=1 Tax=Daphnia magna TaxID=35525 RepID=A0ABR0AGQ8_9CRUS|nr:hypothetical protein OUZ56_009633 [Daphnia magna]
MDGQVLLIGKRFLICENLYDFSGLRSTALGNEVVNTLSGALESWPMNSAISIRRGETHNGKNWIYEN